MLFHRIVHLQGYMQELVIRKRWAPWWLALGAAVLSAIFGWTISRSLSIGENGEEGIRIFISLCLVGAYLALAIIVNVRKTEVSPNGLKIWVGPLPVGSSISVPRAEIALCYARHYIGYHKKAVVDSFYTSGIQTTDGRQIDVTTHIKMPDQALRVAQDLAEALNDPISPVSRIDAGWVQFSPDRSHRAQVLIWAFLFVFAVIVGAFWDVQSRGGR